MNILKKEKDIYGKYSSERIHNSTEEFFIPPKELKRSWAIEATN